MRAAATGTATAAGSDRGSGMKIMWSSRTAARTARSYSVYAHLARASLAVRAGGTVARGALLGRVGRTGCASGNHLHFEIRRAPNPAIPWQFATVLDPLTWIRERRATPVETGGPRACSAGRVWPESFPRMSRRASLSRALWWRMLHGRRPDP